MSPNSGIFSWSFVLIERRPENEPPSEIIFLDREFIDIYNYRYQLVTSYRGGALFSGLVKRINKGLKRLNVEDLSSLEKTLSEEGGRCAKFTEF